MSGEVMTSEPSWQQVVIDELVIWGSSWQQVVEGVVIRGHFRRQEVMNEVGTG